VTSARNGIPKVYRVKVKGIPTENAIERLRRGVRLDDGVRTAPAEILPLEQTGVNAWFQMTLHEGRNQQIRRMFDAIGHSVLKLSRERIGALSDAKMKPGEFRILSPAEVKRFYRPMRESSRPTKGARRRLRVSSR
jgi:23S rRNA pseudouridine2605 synthase